MTLIENLHELNNGHLGIVTLSGHSSQDAGVTTGTVGITLWCCLEQGMDEVLVVDPAQGLSAGVEVTALSELNHVIHVLTDGLGADEGGFDSAVADHLSGQGSEEGLALIGGLTKLGHSLAVTHHGEITLAASDDVGGFEGGHGGTRKAAGGREGGGSTDACYVEKNGWTLTC